MVEPVDRFGVIDGHEPFIDTLTLRRPVFAVADFDEVIKLDEDT